MTILHRATNLRFAGYDKATGRFSFTVPSASRPGKTHTFSVDTRGQDARCTCDSFLGKGWCSLTRDAANIALAGYTAVYERLSPAALTALDRRFAARTDLGHIERRAWNIVGDILMARSGGDERAA